MSSWFINQCELSFQMLSTDFLYFCRPGLFSVTLREGLMSIPEAPFDLLERQMSDDPSSTGEMVTLFPLQQ